MTRQEGRETARKSLRLGDKVERVLQATGIASVVKQIEQRTGWDCGCSKRRKWLNRY